MTRTSDALAMPRIDETLQIYVAAFAEATGVGWQDGSARADMAAWSRRLFEWPRS